MTEDREDPQGLGGQLLDLVVFAPIGFALEAKELIPKLADRGRGQIALARLAGKFASDKGQSEARKVADQVMGFVGNAVAGTQPEDDNPDETLDLTDSDDSGLPISDYNQMSAPELLPHLEALSESGLAEILEYEGRHRSRATIINRVKQLQG